MAPRCRCTHTRPRSAAGQEDTRHWHNPSATKPGARTRPKTATPYPITISPQPDTCTCSQKSLSSDMTGSIPRTRSIAQIEMLGLLFPGFQSDRAALGRGASPHANRVSARLQGEVPRSALPIFSIDPNVTPGRNRDSQLSAFLSLRLRRGCGGFGGPGLSARSRRFLGSPLGPRA